MPAAPTPRASSPEGPTADDFVTPPLLPPAEVAASAVVESAIGVTLGTVEPAVEVELVPGDALADPTVPVSTIPAAQAVDELLPPPEARDAVRRKARFGRWGRIGAGAVGGLLLVVLLVALVMNGGNDSTGTGTTAQGRDRNRNRTSPSSRSGSLGSTTTSTTTDGTEIGSPTTASSSPGNSNPGGTGADPGIVPVAPPPDVDPKKVVTLTQTPGTCRYDPGSSDLFVDGTATNSSGQAVTAEFDISWQDDTGELDSWSDLVSIGPHGSETWSETGSAADPPVGALRCVVTLVG